MTGYAFSLIFFGLATFIILLHRGLLFRPVLSTSKANRNLVKVVENFLSQRNEEIVSNLTRNVKELENALRKEQKQIDELAELADNDVSASRTSQMSLLVVCEANTLHKLPRILNSIERQSILPQETVIAVTMPVNSSEEMNWHQFADRKIPSLRFHVLGGATSTGSARKYLMEHSSLELISFFTCDDYMHPQRTELLDELFKAHGSLEAILHGFVLVHEKDWDDNASAPDPAERYLEKLPETTIENWSALWPYDTLWSSPPFKTGPTNSSKWELDSELKEPNHSSDVSKHWFFPADMGLVPSIPTPAHNSWITFRRSVAHEVVYPENKQGCDSLFVWRLLKAKKKFSFLPFKLGVYIV